MSISLLSHFIFFFPHFRLTLYTHYTCFYYLFALFFNKYSKSFDHIIRNWFWFQCINVIRVSLKNSRCRQCQHSYWWRKAKLLIKWWEQERRSYRSWLRSIETKESVILHSKKVDNGIGYFKGTWIRRNYLISTVIPH